MKLDYCSCATKMVVVQSVTNEEIARYWKQRHILEQDHLFAALKAAAPNLSVSLSHALFLCNSFSP